MNQVREVARVQMILKSMVTFLNFIPNMKSSQWKILIGGVGMV